MSKAENAKLNGVPAVSGIIRAAVPDTLRGPDLGDDHPLGMNRGGLRKRLVAKA
jgi:hypothetical protein